MGLSFASRRDARVDVMNGLNGDKRFHSSIERDVEGNAGGKEELGKKGWKDSAKLQMNEFSPSLLKRHNMKKRRRRAHRPNAMR